MGELLGARNLEQKSMHQRLCQPDRQTDSACKRNDVTYWPLRQTDPPRARETSTP